MTETAPPLDSPLQAPDWNDLLAALRPLILQVARQDLRLSAEDSEDVCQLVSLKVYDAWAGLRRPEALAAWVRSVTRRTALDLLRARRPSVSLEELAWEPAEGEGWPERVETRADLERALAGVSEQYREPLWLHHGLGYSQEEIGRRLARPRNTVASQISRGLAQLREALAA